MCGYRVAAIVIWLCFLGGAVCDPVPHSKRTYSAPKRTRPIVIDGDLSEWRDVPGYTMDSRKFLFVGQGMSARQWLGPQDLSATFKVQWDEHYIYIAVEVEDDHVEEPHGALQPGIDTGSWDDDSVEIMLDNDGCGMSRYYVGDPLHHEFHFVYSSTKPLVFDNFWKYQPGAAQPMFKLPDGRKEPLAFPDEVMAKNEVTEVFSKPPYNGAFAFERTAVGYNLEIRMALPGAKMAAIDHGGHVIGFDVAVNDNDLGYGPAKQELHWSGVNDMFWRNTAYFGQLLLKEK